MKSALLNGLVMLILFTISHQMQAAPINSQQATNIVAHWLSIDPTPMENPIYTQIGEVDTLCNNLNQPLFHVVHLIPSGYVIVSADDVFDPIMGFSEQDQFISDETNPLIKILRYHCEQRIALLSPRGKTQKQWQTPHWKWQALRDMSESNASSRGTKAFTYLNELSDVRVAPLVKTSWGQSTLCGEYCYNLYTPNHSVAGCGATALAQLLRFNGYPIDPVGPQERTIRVEGEEQTATLLGGDGLGGAYLWDQMIARPNCDITEVQRQAIGALCYDVGVAVGMSYTLSSSSSSISNIHRSLTETFRYSQAVLGSSNATHLGLLLFDMVHPNLDAGLPTLLNLRSMTGGHFVLLDGYGYNFDTLYHHINMGWNGSSNAWYHLPDFRPNSYYTVHYCIYNVFREHQGEIISGRVTQHSKPVAHIHVTATDSLGAIRTTTTNDHGIYAFTDIPANSTWVLTVEDSEFDQESTLVTVGKSMDETPCVGNRWGIDFPKPDVSDILYVDPTAIHGNQDGSSWEDAFIDLQQALYYASHTQDQVKEIWVAQGRYCPDQGSGLVTLSFQMLDGVALYGGFSGHEFNRSERDPDLYPTILSGDVLANDDSNDPNTLLDNSYHVVNASGVKLNAILDGFTITGGNAIGGRGNEMNGGGMYINCGSPTIIDCNFVANRARYGAGILIQENSDPIFMGCQFIDNDANRDGGAVYANVNSDPTFIDCLYNFNTASRYGGAIGVSGTTCVVMTQCSFTANQADWGGGVFVSGNCDANIINCIFTENQCISDGGAISSSNCQPKITGCIFHANTAGDDGGGLRCYQSSPTITNCLFYENRCKDNGAAIYDGSGNNAVIAMSVINCTLYGNVATDRGGGICVFTQGTPIVKNTIMRQNQDKNGFGYSSQIHCTGPEANILYSCIQDISMGSGNITLDPQFVDPANGDFHLESVAGHWIDTNTWWPDTMTSPCIDRGDPSSPLGMEPIPHGGRINMGAYGGTAQASLSP